MKPEYSLKHLCEQQDRMYLLQEWDWNKNSPLTPDAVHKGSHQKVWLKCSDGHVRKAAIYSRTGKDKCGCPVCAGKVKQSSYLFPGQIVDQR